MHSIAQSIRDRARLDFIEPAKARGESIVTIRAGDLVRSLGLQNRTPAVCSALRSKAFIEQCHLDLVSQEGPPSGMSTTMRFTYRLLDSDRAPASNSKFESLAGIGAATYRSLGGGARFIEEERANFGSK